MQRSLAPARVDVGTVIAGTYTIEALVGRGGMGAVFLASHNRLPGKKVAIKVLHAELSGDEIMARFKREAQIASLLSHPNIVHIEDYNVTAEGMPYLVLEYLQGESLAQRLRRGPVSLEHTCALIRQVGSALAAAHGHGIVHRDLKPQNIFLVPSELDGRALEIAKVLDFGISKMRDSQTVKTQDSALLGTPQYMAPEQALGQQDNIDERTDVFALGAIVYEMLGGVPAFSGQTIPEVVFKVVYEQPVELASRAPSLPDRVVRAVARAMHKSSVERFDSVASFVEALTGQPLVVSRPSPPLLDHAGSASPRAATTDGDAFARTMDSGDHGGATGGSDGRARVTPAASGGGVDVNAETVDSMTGAGAIAQASPQQSADAPVTVTPPARSRWRLGLGVIVVVAAGGIALYAASGSSSRSSTSAGELDTSSANHSSTKQPRNSNPTGSASTANEEASVDGAGSATAAVDATAAVVDATERAAVTADDDGAAPHSNDDASRADKGDRGSVASVGKSRRSQPGTQPSAEPDDSRAGSKLREAQQQLAAHNWVLAEELANVVLASEDAQPHHTLGATVVQGVAACGRHDDERARIVLRSLQKKPALRRTVLARCHALGVLESVR
jgi:eukaryotic-like serine/threonine-protein kinase